MVIDWILGFFVFYFVILGTKHLGLFEVTKSVYDLITFLGSSGLSGWLMLLSYNIENDHIDFLTGVVLFIAPLGMIVLLYMLDLQIFMFYDESEDEDDEEENSGKKESEESENNKDGKES